MAGVLSSTDLDHLAAHGIAAAAAERQLRQLHDGQVWTRLERPCTVGDGIRRLRPGEQSSLQIRFAAAAAAGRICRFIPASGAATRMFQPLQLPDSDGIARQRFLADLHRFPFADALAAALARAGLDLDAIRRAGHWPTLLATLLDAEGLDYATRPKGLLPFHRSGGEIRTAFDEHLAEAAQLVGRGNPARLHFTVMPEHLGLFQDYLRYCCKPLETRYHVALDVGFSVQDPATDTLALDADGVPLRDRRGHLVLRPGGHGALLTNLAGIDADLVLIRNIDNVVPDAHKADNLAWDRLLGGLLLRLREELQDLLEALRRTPGSVSVHHRAAAFLTTELAACLPGGELTSGQLAALLDRPLRVCGMVGHRGEPGGGPFWVRDSNGILSRQIVETSQIDRGNPEQAALLAAATHFNPVVMACSHRDGCGRPYNLAGFIDPAAAIVTDKRHDERLIRTLEHPGLWNGGMAGWNTVFVELPETTFNPVKTVFDLLRPAHQP